MRKMFEEKYEADLIENDGCKFLHPKDYFNWMARHQYQRRLKGDPLWVTLVVAGVDKKTGEKFLSTSDHLGTKVPCNTAATGIGGYFLGVVFEKMWKPDMSEQEARTMMETCMKIMF